MRYFVVCSKPHTSNTHGLLSRAKLAGTPVDCCGSDASKYIYKYFVRYQIISKMLVGCAAFTSPFLNRNRANSHAKDSEHKRGAKL